MADNNIDVFKMFAAEDRLDGDNYPMWAYMMQHVLVSKGVWNIVQGIDVHPGIVDIAKVVDVAGPSTRTAAARSVLPTAEQARWDVKDAQAHALIALSVKRTITPHICSTKSAKQAWDILVGLYAGRNEAKIALLRKELESKIMNEEDDMDTFLTSIKDINEQLISADLQCLGAEEASLKPEDMNMDDWIELDELARSTIMLTLHKSIYFNVKDTKGAYGVWQALSNLYEKKNAASQVFWLKKLIDLCKKHTTPMSTHLNEFKTILSQLQSQEVKFQDSVKVVFLLVTLPDSWDIFCTAISNSAPDYGLKCTYVESILLMEELNCKNVDDSKSSNAMHARGRQQSRGNHGRSD
ncbi:hypothetical protein L7F22_048110 [Adiantum nelumboides]|nr:hypothetical protein [Adiantum nelumboides]